MKEPADVTAEIEIVANLLGHILHGRGSLVAGGALAYVVAQYIGSHLPTEIHEALLKVHIDTVRDQIPLFHDQAIVNRAIGRAVEVLKP